MILQEAHNLVRQQIQAIYSENEANNIADLTTEYVTGFQKLERILNKSLPLTQQQSDLYLQCIERLLQQEPIQYIMGKSWFYKYPFYVNKQVLIPRPETEELVKHIIDQTTQNHPFILDIGTGSGCIAISLKKNITSTITAIDINKESLKVATQNATALNADVHFIHQDFLDETLWESLNTYDVIVSNPPYIMNKESSEMNQNVLQYEPHIALFVEDDDALIFYRKIALFAKTHLKSNGAIWLEINESLSKETQQLFKSHAYNTTLYKDLERKNRMIKAEKE